MTDQTLLVAKIEAAVARAHADGMVLLAAASSLGHGADHAAAMVRVMPFPAGLLVDLVSQFAALAPPHRRALAGRVKDSLACEDEAEPDPIDFAMLALIRAIDPRLAKRLPARPRVLLLADPTSWADDGIAAHAWGLDDATLHLLGLGHDPSLSFPAAALHELALGIASRR